MGSYLKELVIWHEFDGPGDTSIELLEGLCDEYSRKTGVRVIPEVMNIVELSARLNRIGEGGQAPQMALVPADMAGFGANANYSRVPEELLALAASDGSDFSDSMRSEGIAYGLPVLTGNHLVLYYNREIYPAPPGSWEEIEAGGNGLIDRGLIPIAADLLEPYSFIPFLTAFGGWPMRGNTPCFPKNEMRRALHFVRAQGERGVLASMNGSTELLDRFIGGEIGAIICGEWIYNYLDRQMKRKWGVAPLPSVLGMPSLSMSSSIGLVFPGHSLESELREEILSFAAFMLSEENQTRWGAEVQRIPVHKGAREKGIRQAGADRATLIQLLEKSRPMPIEPVMASVWEAIRPGLRCLMNEGADSAYTVVDRYFRHIAVSLSPKTN